MTADGKIDELYAERDRLYVEFSTAAAIKDAAENVVIAYGMGWDMEGVIDVLHHALAREVEKVMSDDRWAEEIRATIAELSSENRRLKDAMVNRTEERADYNAEISRLRAELAAEKELVRRVNVWLEDMQQASFCTCASEREIDPEEKECVLCMATHLLAAIHASNAAPPLWLAVADAARAQGIQTCKDIRDGYGASMSVEENAAWQAANECVEALEGAAPPQPETPEMVETPCLLCRYRDDDAQSEVTR